MIINGTDLKMIRGDSESITLTIENEDNTPYKFQEGDIVYFTVRLRATSKDIVFQKIITYFPDNEAIIEIQPEDTSGLRFTEYLYDIQLTQFNGRVKTVVPVSTIEMLEEITHD